jgi:hypothetical protein
LDNNIMMILSYLDNFSFFITMLYNVF